MLKVIETRTKDLIQKCLELAAYAPQYGNVWIVFDRDEVADFDQIVDEARRKDIRVGWSNPCFEIWMYAYFGEMPTVQESRRCCIKFAQKYEKVTGHKYFKSDEDIYQCQAEYGDEEKALALARRKLDQTKKSGYKIPSQMCPCTTVYELVGEIKQKAR